MITVFLSKLDQQTTVSWYYEIIREWRLVSIWLINTTHCLYIVCKGVPAPLFLRHPPLDPVCPLPPPNPPFFKSLFPLPSFLFYPLLRYFRQSPPHLHATPSYPNLIYQPSLHTMNGFKQISEGWFYQFNCRFLSKIKFWFFKSLLEIYQVISIYGKFPGSFLDNIEWLFFIKLWWKKKIIFLQMHNTNLQRVKLFVNVKMINLEKIK